MTRARSFQDRVPRKQQWRENKHKSVLRKTRAGKMSQSVKYLSCRKEDLSSIPEILQKCRYVAYDLSTGEEEIEGVPVPSDQLVHERPLFQENKVGSI